MTPAQQAYALLWRSSTEDPFAKRARAALLPSLTREERHAAVQWVLKEYGGMSTNELIAADMRAGVFPERSA